MTITLFRDILNVWYNDAHRVCVFAVVFSLPALVFFFKKYYNFIVQKIKVITSFDFQKIFFTLCTDFLFLLTIIAFILGIVGLGQIKFSWTIDVILRGAGITMFLGGIIGFVSFATVHPILYEFNHEHKFFYTLVRHPYYSLLLLISLGMSFLTVSAIALGITILQMVITWISLPYIEKNLCEKDEFFIDYKYSAPSLLPDIITIIKQLIK